MFMVIDLKSFYAACECSERGLDMFKDFLVVCDKERSPGSITLAVTPSLKKLGVPSRTRAYDLPQNINIIYAKPRMKMYIQYSKEVYKCYLNFFSKNDIYMYSIDEAFVDLTPYELIYPDLIELVKKIQRYIYDKLKLVVTAGIGKNMFMAKVALDVISKHSKDFIGYLDDAIFKEKIWPITKLTDIWSIGPRTQRRLNRLGLFSVKDIALSDPKILQKEFGILGLELHDHANGIDETKLFEAKNVVVKSKSVSEGQILFRDYTKLEAMVVLVEMIDMLTLKLISKGYIAKGISLYIGYSKDIGSVSKSLTLDSYTSDYQVFLKEFKKMYNQNVLDLPIRRICISYSNLTNKALNQLSLFDDVVDNRNENLYLTVSYLKERFGKNSIIRGISLDKNANQRQRNTFIGGHSE